MKDASTIGGRSAVGKLKHELSMGHDKVPAYYAKVALERLEAFEAENERLRAEKAVAKTPTAPLSLLIKLGSIAVHVDELLSVDGRHIDKDVIQNLLNDAEVKEWVEVATKSGLLPVKRR